jgi:inner membrane protein
MLFRTHVNFAIFLFLVLTFILDMPMFVLAFSILGAAFVDIDGKKSRFGKNILLRPLQWITRHRGIFHSIFMAVLISCLIGIFNLWACFGFFIGYVSHLILDAITPAGVALFWPFKFKFKGPVKTGGIFETVFFVLLLLGNIFIVGRMIFYYLF